MQPVAQRYKYPSDTNLPLVVNPEFITPQLSFRVATAKEQFRVLDIKMKTIYSNNIRFGYSYLTQVEPELDMARLFAPDQWFVQPGRRVFKKFFENPSLAV